MITTKQKILNRLVAIFLIAIAGMVFTSVPVPAYAVLYSPGETLNPACAPTDTNCDVVTSALKGRLSEALTGTVGIAPGSSLVTGSSTAFTTELSAGDAIKIGANIFTVSSISSNTSLTLSSAVATSTAMTNGATAYRDPATLFSVAKGDSTNVLTVSKAGLLSLLSSLTFSSGTPSATSNTLYNQGGTLYWNGNQLSGGILSLNNLSSVSQTFATGTSGADFGISSSGSIHTFNIPTASSTVRGLLSSTDWNMFNNKENAITASTTGAYYRGDKTFQTLNTTAVTEGANLYHTDTRTRNALSSSALGLTYATSTGAFSLTGGYSIPLTASTTNWNTAYGWGNHATAGYVSSSTAFTNNGNSFGGLTTLGTTDNNALRLITNNAEAMRILANGNVGIGTTTPSAKLAIAGGFSVSTQTQTGTQTNPSLNAGNGTILGTAIGGTDTVIRYTTTGSSTFTPPTGVTNVRVLVVAGGGGGGVGVGGGGGAGGVISSSTIPVSGSVTVTVGTGGPGRTGDGAGTIGANSVFGSITSTGGGAGAGWNAAAGNGGSGGGGNSGNATFTAGGTGTTGQGSAGGTGGVTLIDGMVGAGGGGSGAVGANGGLATTNGVGGAGVSNDITGTPTFYGGGGGAGLYVTGATTTARLGGDGGGGAGNSTSAAAVAGTANTGGGGGGAQGFASAAGGSGVVIVRFATVGVATSSQALFKVTNAGTDTNSVLAFFETGASQSCIIAGGTGLSCSSDENLKKDIEATESVLGSVLVLKPVTYNWRTAEELGVDGFDPYAAAEGVTGENIGFIAQDVERIFPGLVRVDPNGNRTLAYDKFAPLIVAALQEQYGGMMGINLASVEDFGELFASEETIENDNFQFSILNFQSISNNENDQTKGVAGYLKEKVTRGIKVVRELVTERMVAVSGYFKRIFANELCLTDSSGQLVCVTGENLKQIGGQTNTSQSLQENTVETIDNQNNEEAQEITPPTPAEEIAGGEIVVEVKEEALELEEPVSQQPEESSLDTEDNTPVEAQPEQAIIPQEPLSEPIAPEPTPEPISAENSVEPTPSDLPANLPAEASAQAGASAEAINNGLTQ